MCSFIDLLGGVPPQGCHGDRDWGAVEALVQDCGQDSRTMAEHSCIGGQQDYLMYNLSLDVEAMGRIRWVLRPLEKAPAEMDSDGDGGEGREEEEKLQSVRALAILSRSVVSVLDYILHALSSLLMRRAMPHAGDSQSVQHHSEVPGNHVQ